VTGRISNIEQGISNAEVGKPGSGEEFSILNGRLGENAGDPQLNIGF
jgi:hypothetical protein